MSIIERILSWGHLRRFVWRHWYPYLTRRLQNADACFLNYAFETDPPVGLPLSPEDEPNRCCIQLYHHVASQVDLRGKDVLEVSCGHGGGASWITRAMQPASYTGVDLNDRGIRFCQQRHRVPGLTFAQGDAQQLPFPDESFDAVINIEASHCYPDFPGFLVEVRRVLRPGGHFLYADFRFRYAIDGWQESLAAAFEVVQTRDIHADVRRGMDRNAERHEAFVRQCMPRFLRSSAREFAGLPGSVMYEGFKSGEIPYRSWCLRKR